MEPATKSLVSLFVDRALPDDWVVRDPDGNFWQLPPSRSP